MNTQMERPRGQDDPLHHNAGEGEHHEKKSVLKKVKAKAKKIKDTLAGKSGNGGNGGNGDEQHDRGYDDHDDGYEEEDEEMEIDHGVHGGAQSTESSDPTAQGYIPGTRLPISAPVNPAGTQKFDPTGASYTPGLEEALSHSRTDTGSKPLGSKDQSFASSNMPVAAHSGVSHGAGLVDGRKPFDVHSGGIHGASPLGKGAHADDISAGTPIGFAPTSTPVLAEDRIHGAGIKSTDALGTHDDAGALSGILAGGTHDTGVHDAGAFSGTRAGVTHDTGAVGTHAGVLGTGPQGGGILDRPIDLEEDPHVPKGEWEAREPGNYQTKVIDPTGLGAEEKEVNPIVNKLDKMNINEGPDQPHLTREPHIGEEETRLTPPNSVHGLGTLSSDGTLTTGSHDQFSPEPITPETSTFLMEPAEYETVQSLDDDVDQQKQNQGGTYTEKVSSAASMAAEKAKQATSAVTSKLGYGGGASGTDRSQVAPTEQQYDTQQSEKESPLTSVTAVIADKASNAKDMMASKLGGGSGRTTTEEGREGELNTRSGDAVLPTDAELPESGGPVHEEPSSAVGPIGDYGKKMASTVYEKVAGVGSTVASKLPGYGGTTTTTQEGEQNTRSRDVVLPTEADLPESGGPIHEEPANNTGSVAGYGKQVAATVYDKVVGVGSTVASKLPGYGGTTTTQEGEQNTRSRDTVLPTEAELPESGGAIHEEPANKTGSVAGYGKLVASTVYDKVAGVGSTVASKLPGYGGTTTTTQEGQQNTRSRDQVLPTEAELPESGGAIHEEPANMTGSVAGYGKQVASTVYDKVAGVGSVVASKVPGLGSGTTEQREVGAATNVPPADKGVSMKEYIAEKLKPGEQDRALSKAITESLPLRKQTEGPTTGVDEDKKVPVKGRVIESVEVRRRLGPYDDTSEENAGSGPASPGKAVLDRIKDAATSWFGKGGETQPLEKGFKDNTDTSIDETEVTQQVKKPQLQ